MNREQRRALRKRKLSEEEKKLSDKIFLFDKLPDKCNACEEPFDKTDKGMVQEWSVVIRNKNESVKLFCPGCIDRMKTFIEEKRND
tara:strand:+ start:480 stop:737 length:258 start_codon:yes stop_codon:yes gene_type:complete